MRKTRILPVSPGRAALAPLFGLILAASAVPAETGPRYPSGPDYIDPVTGYLCVTPFCDVLRQPRSNCICQKENPGERKLSRLRLTCSTREAGAWVACPVKSPYGITINRKSRSGIARQLEAPGSRNCWPGTSRAGSPWSSGLRSSISR